MTADAVAADARRFHHFFHSSPLTSVGSIICVTQILDRRQCRLRALANGPLGTRSGARARTREHGQEQGQEHEIEREREEERAGLEPPEN
jgi:hypothetical protein